METIKFIDEIIQTNEKEFEFYHEKIKVKGVCYNCMTIFECFDKIVNLFISYDPDTKSEFTAYFDCYKPRRHFHDPLIIFPLNENGMKEFKEDIVQCFEHYMLIVEWENYLKAKGIKELPFKLINLAFYNECVAKIMDHDDIALVFSVDRFYKDR